MHTLAHKKNSTKAHNNRSFILQTMMKANQQYYDVVDLKESNESLKERDVG